MARLFAKFSFFQEELSVILDFVKSGCFNIYLREEGCYLTCLKKEIGLSNMYLQRFRILILFDSQNHNLQRLALERKSIGSLSAIRAFSAVLNGTRAQHFKSLQDLFWRPSFESVRFSSVGIVNLSKWNTRKWKFLPKSEFQSEEVRRDFNYEANGNERF